MSEHADFNCIGNDPLWDVLCWAFLAGFFWLWFLFFADAKEREKIWENTHTSFGPSFFARSILWLIVLMLSAFGAALVWRQKCWDKGVIVLLPYMLSLLALWLAWRFFWVSHRFFASFIATLFAALFALFAALAAAEFSGFSAFALICFAIALFIEMFLVWVFYKSNRDRTIGSRDLGRFQQRTAHANANVFVLSQNPALHVIPSGFVVDPEPETFGEYINSDKSARQERLNVQLDW